MEFKIVSGEAVQFQRGNLPDIEEDVINFFDEDIPAFIINEDTGKVVSIVYYGDVYRKPVDSCFVVFRDGWAENAYRDKSDALEAVWVNNRANRTNGSAHYNFDEVKLE